MSSSDPDSRLLLLMRHGKADSGAGQPDHERRLTDRGHSQAQLVGEYLESQNVRPTRVLVSDAARTRETWEHLLSTMHGFDGTVSLHEDIYNGGTTELAALIRSCADEDAVVMVIGHEPTMSSMVAQLADDDSDAGSVAQARIGLPTGAMGVLSGPLAHWSELTDRSLTLHTIVRP